MSSFNLNGDNKSLLDWADKVPYLLTHLFNLKCSTNYIFTMKTFCTLLILSLTILTFILIIS